MAHQPAQSGSPVAGAVAAGQALALGNTTRMLQIGVPVEALKPQAEMLRASGAGVMHLAVDGKLAGLLSVSDPIKESPPEAWSSLTASGLRIVMATGDGLTTAMAVGKRLGIDEVHGEIKPAGKLQLVEQLQREGRIVAMAGDGINDAPFWSAAQPALLREELLQDADWSGAIGQMNLALRHAGPAIRVPRPDG